MEPADRAAWTHALNRLDRRDHQNNPVAWTADVMGEHLWSVQRNIAMDVAQNRLVAVQSCHGIGKSHLASRLALWFVDTRPIHDTMVVTSAPTAHQVKSVLWRYIRQGHEAKGMHGIITQGQVPEWKIEGNLVAFGRRPADHQQSSFQGIHAPHLLVILDEACGLPKWLWDASDSLMSGENDQHLLAIGNPDDNSSHFYSVCTSEPNWTRHQVSAFDCPAFTGEQVPDHVAPLLTNVTYVQDKKDRWGEDNPLYKVKVLGEFVDSEDALIPMSWVKAAQARWHAWDEAGRPELGPRVYGVDVARYGVDDTVIITREQDVVFEVERFSKQDTMVTAELVRHRLIHPKSLAMVDVIGVGAGVVDKLRHDGCNVAAFNAAKRTDRRDSTGSWRFDNVRSAAWWNLRELLDPSTGATLALPPDDDLTADLVTPTWNIYSGGIIKVESKDDTRKRLKRSTDFGDALCMAMWSNPAGGRAETEEKANTPPPVRKRGSRVRRYSDSIAW